MKSNNYEQNKIQTGGFKFVKKKNESNLITSINQTTNTLQVREKEYDNYGNINNIDDLNSDTKSFRSLRINNNMKNENISVNLDKDDDEDNKSIKNLNNTSTITNPLKENLTSGLTNENSNNPSIKIIITNKPRKDNYKTPFINSNNPEQVKKRYYEEITRSEDSVRDLIVKVHSLKVKQKTKEKELNEMNTRLETLYQFEEEAIQNNNFDEAQEIENKISIIKEAEKKILAAVEDCKQDMINYRELELMFIRNKWKILEETCNSFSKLKSQQEYELENFQNTDVNRHKNDKMKIKKLKEKLDFLKTNLDSDKNYIDEEEEKINRLIKSQSSGVFDELDELNQSKSLILEEIENLKKMLDIKFAEMDIVDKNIEAKEIEIDAIKSTFNHEFNKINFKKKNYEENLKDFTEQEKLYQNMLKVYESEEGKYDDKIQKIQKSVIDLDLECQEFKNQLKSLYDVKNKKDFLLKNENEINSKIHLIQMKYHKTNELKENNLKEIQNLELNSEKLEAEILGIEIKIPTLEQEKKGFVVLRNFKEAGRVSNELKNILEKKTSNLNQIQENKNKIYLLKIENENIDLELNKIKECINLEETELNITKYEYLISYKEQLENLIDNLKTKSSGNDADFIEEEFVFLQNEMKIFENLNYIREKFIIKVQEASESLEEIENVNKSVEIKEENIEQADEGIADADGENKDIEKEDIEHEIDENLNKSDCNKQNSEEEAEEIQEEVVINQQELKNKIDELMHDLQKCVEDEDFDSADLIQTEIDSLTKLLE